MIKKIIYGILISVFIFVMAYIVTYKPEVNIDEPKEELITDGLNCFANGILCKDISCDMPGGCYAKDCVSGVEFEGAVKIKCINISRSK